MNGFEIMWQLFFNYRKRQKALLNNTDDTNPVLDEKNPLVSMEVQNGITSTSRAQPLVVKISMLSARFKGGKKRASHALKRKNLEISIMKNYRKVKIL